MSRTKKKEDCRYILYNCRRKDFDGTRKYEVIEEQETEPENMR